MFNPINRVATLSTILILTQLAAASQNLPKYNLVKGGAFSGIAVPHSPDPLVNYYWNNPDVFDSLQYFPAKYLTSSCNPSSAAAFKGDEILVSRDCDILFDFGREYAAWPEFECNELNAEVEVSISEYNEPAILNAGAEHPVKTARPARYGNTYRLELNKQLYEGVRFAWLHIRHITKPFRIKNFRLICQAMPVNYLGSFNSDDEQLNKIWYTGAYTVRLNLLPNYFGAILMERSDRHSWTGDAYPAQAAALAAFGNYKSIRENIDYTSKLDNGIPAYALYWVLSLVEYYLYTGDKTFLKTRIGIAEQHLQKAFAHFDSLPRLAFLGWDERLGAGFERPDLPECQAVYRFLALDAWRQFASVLEMAGEPMLAKKYRDYYLQKSAQMLNKEAIASYGIHAISKALNAGMLSRPYVRQAAALEFADRINRLSYSPFNQYFIIQAMAKANELDKAIVTIKDNWGGQLAYGGTSFFEVFRPSWNDVLNRNDAPPNNQCGYTSLAHPWGAGVTKWLSENILGIRPLAPGFRKVEISPFPGSTITKLKGAMPTPHGNIGLNLDIKKGEANVVIPKGVDSAKIGIPLMGKTIVAAKIYRNKVLLLNVASVSDSLYYYFDGLTAGTYTIQYNYSTTAKKQNQEEKIEHSIYKFRIDSTTQGNWIGKFGGQGYFFPATTHQPGHFKYPSYVDSIKMNLHAVKVWDTASKDQRALQSTGDATRWAAAAITRDPLATLQTMTIDIHCNEEKIRSSGDRGKVPAQLSLYFLDWDKKGRRSAIEIFDLKTLKLIAPVQIVGAYEGGKYLSFSFHSSIRVRVNHVKGENAAVSAVFLDGVK